MKILLLNSVDSRGGAARSAQRLCKGLRENDVSATMLVQRKLSSDDFALDPGGFWKQWLAEIRPHLDALPVCLFPNRTRAIFSPAFLPESVRKKVVSIRPDLIHLHWVCEGLIRLESLCSLNLPVVWTLHDSWPFTGGCHLPSDCSRYEHSCGCCPTLGSTKSWDLSSWVWKRKRDVFRGMNMTFVAPSAWMAEKARSSSLLRSNRIEVIPNGLDISLYRPHDKQCARKLLGLPLDKKLILFNAMSGCVDPNKGFGLLCEALQSLWEEGRADDCELVILGSLPSDERPNIKIPCRFLGRFADDVSIVLALSAADVSVIPSLQENLPYSVMESMACGTPPVAFRVGGIPEMIDHRENGYLVDAYDVKEFGKGIEWVISGADGAPLAGNARSKVEQRFSIDSVTGRYIQLYQQIL